MSDLAPQMDLKSKVSERIRSTFLDLIPPEAFEEMVAKEIQDFTRDRPAASYNGDPVKSPLKQMIEAEIRRQFQQLVEEELKKPEYQAKWINGGLQPSEFVKAVVAENITAIVAAQYNQMLTAVAQSISSQLSQVNPRFY